VCNFYFDSKVPKGILATVFISFFIAAFSIFTSSQIIRQVFNIQTHIYSSSINLLIVSFIGLSLLFLGLAWIISAIGLISIKPWGWALATWSYILAIPIFIIVTIFVGLNSHENLVDHRLQGMVLLSTILVLFYLKSRSVKHIYFR